MKNRLKGAMLIVLILVFANHIKAQIQNPKTETAIVLGNCGMCKATIEKAANEENIVEAVWDKEKKILTYTYDSQKTSKEKILKKIAEVGYDNELYRADEDTYKKLPQCCLYTRQLSNTTPKSEEDSIQKEDHHHDHHQKAKQIDKVVVTKVGEATSLNKKEVGLTFNISSRELLKAACCNLSESFETNATVDVAFTNAVTGSKQLRMLGLEQKYTSLTKELLPEIRGLASAYGLNFIPGRWVSSIQLTKGGSSVVNGYESITGQINTEMLKMGENKTELNIFLDAFGRSELNLVGISSSSEHWTHAILTHGNGTFMKMDTNNDGFLDQPTGTQINTSYIASYNALEHLGWASQLGINFLKDSRQAGQINYNWKKSKKEQDNYGVGIDLSRIQLWNKTGHIFKNKPYQSIGLMNQFTYHQQDSFFGKRTYFGKQQSFYSNLIFESIIGNTNHKYKVGGSFLYDAYDEDYLAQNFVRTERVGGAFAEYILTGAVYTLVAGLRSDFHNLAGTQLSPRLNFKYDIDDKTIIRLSAGRGFRTANIFAENQNFFASNRTIEILNPNGKIYGLSPEIAWNYGLSLQKEFKLFKRKASWVTDVFRTDFQNQVIVDLDYSPQKMLFYNLEGESRALAFQTQLDFSPANRLDFRLAYKYYDVWADYLEGRREVPFIAKHRGFINMAYSTTKNSKQAYWNLDATLQWVGFQRLPNTYQNPEEYQTKTFTKPYALLNAQVSRFFNRNIRLYLGAENLTSYTQEHPIIDAKNPFSNYFDGGMIYAPIMPANFYTGIDVSF
ncbi:TonB-dependent receptor domain-containing protein [Riemerella anatipestifer]|uniref:TonB-dependent receptor domain-containing protein n=1 Tax=Riemerella anatipestifer TaxID=34085 RepID=UPI00129DA711|nr:TonB-dependent receptor [Riemerella anatipestifer]MBT0550878.1 TonB-dependent receptor [Riemerella anatipestifer]MBT0553024.1 TonB-dependent receptor [Riemerella anatipestifer]MCE3023720.1 TonB-dependent receptor [Riemerella anatipestifer]MCU7541838.1 TonB-dependent receptor [Riemerella anatipestifer]MCU7559629.1 TonB-dependent receptor [Riemerella anatipestifer]